MKRYKYIWSACLSILLLAISCTDEEMGKRVEVVEGLPVTVKMKVSSAPIEEIQTKAASSPDLYIFLFDATGNRVETSPSYFTSISGGEGNITFETTTGSRKIYAIANLSVNNLSVSKDELDKIQTLKGLQSLTVSMEKNSVSNLDGNFMLSGFWAASNSATDAVECAIDTDGRLTPTGSINTSDGKATDGNYEIKLKRLQSEINFVVNTQSQDDKFTLTSYQIVNIPEASKLIESEDATTSAVFATNVLKDMNSGGKSFTFHMFENKYKNVETCTEYESREASPTMNTQNHATIINDWTNAPTNSTYVVLKGHYSGKAAYDSDGKQLIGETTQVEADVTYYIHLGYTEGNAKDFSSLRNKRYTYNVKVAGVDKIILEVTTEDDTPGAQGDVYFSTGQNVLTNDCHYGSILMKFAKADLVKEDVQIKILVKSNLTSGFEEKDLKWLTFVKMEGTPQKAALYPGKDKVISAEEFMKQLTAFSQESANSDASCYYTCFVNEYYPIDTNVNWKQYVNLPEDRIAQIICRQQTGNDSRIIDAAYIIRQHPILSFYNIDKVETAWGVEWTNEVTNTMKINNKDYEIGLPYGTPKFSPNSDTDGRSNMLAEIGTDQSWYDKATYANATDYEGNLHTAYAACMQRNRDENGNGKIDPVEVKWYLPALYQYTDMSIGMHILPQDVQLYSDEDYREAYTSGNKKYWMFKHFVSNTNKMVFWAEEGGPYGDFEGTGDGKIFNDKSVPNGERQYRCIRNLGKIDKFATFASQNNNIVDLSNVAPDALRTDRLSSGELREHDERDPLSRPYSKFEVGKNNTITSGWATQNRQADKNGTSACSNYKQDGNDGEGWRLPNMRELLLMVKLGLVTESTMSRTYYSFYKNDRAVKGDDTNNIGTLKEYTIYSPYDGASRQGFAYNNFVHLINPGDPISNIRCVRDKQ